MGHWLVIDLEATTDDGGWPVTEMEVIEIGASLVTREGREVDHFQRFVKPRRRPQLTPFCRELTHISQADVDTLKGSGSRLAVGTTLSRGELMHLALMSSENRAAHALGRTYPGGMLNFVRLMNAKAAELGMRDTRYVEPTGLSVENRSSARDLALLVAAAYQRPLLREFSTSQGYSVDSGRRVLQYRNSNRLTADPKWDIDLQKTGYISEAGRCMVMSAKLAGRQVIMVFLDAADKSARIGDAQRVRRYVESVVSADAIERLAWRKG